MNTSTVLMIVAAILLLGRFRSVAAMVPPSNGNGGGGGGLENIPLVGIQPGQIIPAPSMSCPPGMRDFGNGCEAFAIGGPLIPAPIYFPPTIPVPTPISALPGQVVPSPIFAGVYISTPEVNVGGASRHGIYSISDPRVF